MAHKSLAGFALGSQVLAARPSLRWYCAQTGAFAVASPMGAVLSGLLPAEVAPSVIALASGTFLFVGAVEVAGRDLARTRGDSWWVAAAATAASPHRVPVLV